MTVDIAIVLSGISIIIAVASFMATRHKDDNDQGKEAGMLKEQMETMAADIREIKQEVKTHAVTTIKFEDLVRRVENLEARQQ